MVILNNGTVSIPKSKKDSVFNKNYKDNSGRHIIDSILLLEKLRAEEEKENQKKWLKQKLESKKVFRAKNSSKSRSSISIAKRSLKSRSSAVLKAVQNQKFNGSSKSSTKSMIPSAVLKAVEIKE